MEVDERAIVGAIGAEACRNICGCDRRECRWDRCPNFKEVGSCHNTHAKFIVSASVTSKRVNVLLAVTSWNHHEDALIECNLSEQYNIGAADQTSGHASRLIGRADDVARTKVSDCVGPSRKFAGTFFHRNQREEVRLRLWNNARHSVGTSKRIARFINPVPLFIQRTQLTKDSRAVIWIANLGKLDHGLARLIDDVRQSWGVVGRTSNPGGFCKPLPLVIGLVEIFVALPIGEVNDRNPGTTSAEQFIALVNQLTIRIPTIKRHDTAAVKNGFESAVVVTISRDTNSKIRPARATCEQTVALAQVGGSEITVDRKFFTTNFNRDP